MSFPKFSINFLLSFNSNFPFLCKILISILEPNKIFSISTIWWKWFIYSAKFRWKMLVYIPYFCLTYKINIIYLFLNIYYSILRFHQFNLKNHIHIFFLIPFHLFFFNLILIFNYHNNIFFLYNNLPGCN